MRTVFEFTSTAFPPYEDGQDAVQECLYGRRLAEHLAAALGARGYTVLLVTPEDWGWVVELDNKAFPLWIGCGSDMDVPNGFRCFIEPSSPTVRKWFRKTDTRSVVEPLADALEAILREQSDDVRRLAD